LKVIQSMSGDIEPSGMAYFGYDATSIRRPLPHIKRHQPFGLLILPKQ
jgi:hypothetical protein